MSVPEAPTYEFFIHAPPMAHRAVRPRGVPDQGITVFAFAYTDARPAPITWDEGTAELGRLEFHSQTWTVHAHLDAARYAKYDQDLASTPALISTPDKQIVSYPVQTQADATTRFLLHAPHFLTWRYPHLAGPIDWQPRELASGHLAHEATLATIKDTFGTVPIVARHDQALIDIGDGDVRDMVARIGNEGNDRQFILPVNSMEIMARDLFHRLAENGSLC